MARLADDHVELEADAADLVAAEEVSGEGGDVGGREAEAVFARVRGGEGEFAGAGAALGDDAVVVVEGFVYGYEDALVKHCELIVWERVRRRGGCTISRLSVYIRAWSLHICAR